MRARSHHNGGAKNTFTRFKLDLIPRERNLRSLLMKPCAGIGVLEGLVLEREEKKKNGKKEKALRPSFRGTRNQRRQQIKYK